MGCVAIQLPEWQRCSNELYAVVSNLANKVSTEFVTIQHLADGML